MLARHLITLGPVAESAVMCAAEKWRAEQVNGRLTTGQVLLALYDPKHTTPQAFVSLLKKADAMGIDLGTLPVNASEPVPPDWERLVGYDSLHLSLPLCSFRIGGSPQAGDLDAPGILRRAEHEDARSVANDLEQSDLLFLQGHSGPIDGSFGRLLTLCGRGLQQPGEPALFPCAGAERCFRQPSQGRGEGSTEGLIDPRRIAAQVVVIDGCGTFPVPGSIYCYEQSLLRGLVLGRMSAAVLSLGISATPMSAIVLFMALLARGRPLGEVVRDVNRHRQRSASPASIAGTSAAPWVLVGNPAATVCGLLLNEAAAAASGDALSWRLPLDGCDARDTGMLISVGGLPADIGPVDARCKPERWVSGALHHDGHAYLWLGPSRSKGEPSHVTLEPRPAQEPAAWRETLRWLQAGSQWLRGLAAALMRRDLDPKAVLALIELRDELAALVEQAACASTPYRALEIDTGLHSATEPLRHALEQLDRATAQTVATAVPHIGARLSHLWSPPWLHSGTRPTGQHCACGCAIVGHARRHPLLDLHRIELSCPACSLIGDAAGGPSRSVAQAALNERRPVRGAELRWSLERSPGHAHEHSLVGCACANLFDPFRNHRLQSEVAELAPGASAELAIDIPQDWPHGMSWTTLIFAAGGAVSMFAFDIQVRECAGAPAA